MHFECVSNESRKTESPDLREVQRMKMNVECACGKHNEIATLSLEPVKDK